MTAMFDEEMLEGHTYHPLPHCVTIKASPIHGLGLFATEQIKKGYCLGIAHIRLDGFPQGYFRTPLGGFYNHSDKPNCELINTKSVQREPSEYFDTYDLKTLHTIRDIKPGEEITCKYTISNF